SGPEPQPRAPLFPYTTLFRSPRRPVGGVDAHDEELRRRQDARARPAQEDGQAPDEERRLVRPLVARVGPEGRDAGGRELDGVERDRKSTRLNSSHVSTSYAVF